MRSIEGHPAATAIVRKYPFCHGYPSFSTQLRTLTCWPHHDHRRMILNLDSRPARPDESLSAPHGVIPLLSAMKAAGGTAPGHGRPVFDSPVPGTRSHPSLAPAPALARRNGPRSLPHAPAPSRNSWTPLLDEDGSCRGKASTTSARTLHPVGIARDPLRQATKRAGCRYRTRSTESSHFPSVVGPSQLTRRAVNRARQLVVVVPCQHPAAGCPLAMPGLDPSPRATAAHLPS